MEPNVKISTARFVVIGRYAAVGPFDSLNDAVDFAEAQADPTDVLELVLPST